MNDLVNNVTVEGNTLGNQKKSNKANYKSLPDIIYFEFIDIKLYSTDGILLALIEDIYAQLIPLNENDTHLALSFTIYPSGYSARFPTYLTLKDFEKHPIWQHNLIINVDCTKSMRCFDKATIPLNIYNLTEWAEFGYKATTWYPC